MVFSKDSKETKVAEDIPGLGLIAAAIHKGADNDEHAKRAAAKGTNSALTVGGGVLGGVTGGPAGAMAGAAAGSAAGIGSEHGVSTHINDDEVRSEVGSVKPERFGVETSLAAVAGGTGGAGKEITKGIAREAGVHGLKKGGGAKLQPRHLEVPRPKL
ncbi:hypothetical protein HBH70_229530 [Parastagonospora nodorum]|nr:hypothetical protein HBH52_215170 [Parastagonospora nodorum]KAH4152055.1 hypothetical protein HBH43_235620 [Parastagonospora nodorum]KAH4206016.1 hypothetical protein HBI95_122930 [Parastagonospora nodorum]KAH4217448.1 hypothetical protein HBI06_213500 [Parastagonospora nodorum]KAH4229562.1 hypothetical protein HBI05_197490 [Parastagonospora nodorum]